MANDDDRVALICAPCSTSSAGVVGSKKEPCCYCKQPCWTSPATRRQAESESKHVRFVCAPCAIKHLDLKSMPLVPPNRETVEELITSLTTDPRDVN